MNCTSLTAFCLFLDPPPQISTSTQTIRVSSQIILLEESTNDGATIILVHPCYHKKEIKIFLVCDKHQYSVVQ